MELCIQRAATNLNDGDEIVFSDLAVSLAIDIIGQAAFGADSGLSRTPGDETKGADRDEAAKCGMGSKQEKAHSYPRSPPCAFASQAHGLLVRRPLAALRSFSTGAAIARCRSHAALRVRAAAARAKLAARRGRRTPAPPMAPEMSG